MTTYPNPPPKEPTTTHKCFDGVVRPGVGPNGRGADKCNPCKIHELKENKKRKKEEAWKTKVSRLRLRVGNSATIKHGFYRKTLQPDELTLALDLHAKFYQDYPTLDPLADDILVMQLVTNLVKSMREAPLDSKTAAEMRAQYERSIREILDKLALTPKQRQNSSAENDDFAKMLTGLRRKVDEKRETRDPLRDNQPKP